MPVKIPYHISHLNCHVLQGVDDCSQKHGFSQISYYWAKADSHFLPSPDLKVGAIDIPLRNKHGLYIGKLPYTKYTQFPAITALLDTTKR